MMTKINAVQCLHQQFTTVGFLEVKLCHGGLATEMPHEILVPENKS